MDSRNLENFSIPLELSSYEVGVGVIPIFYLADNNPHTIVGEYHNKGALSPTVGSHFKNTQSIYANLENAFARKRLGILKLDDTGLIDEKAYFSVNKKQNFARVTFVQTLSSSLSPADFEKTYLEPMKREALCQRRVSEFFWKLSETESSKESKFKFKSPEERSQFAKQALEGMQASTFGLDKTIISQLEKLQDAKKTWEEKEPPLEFYGKNGGRKYSELTDFYLMPLEGLVKQFSNRIVKEDKEKPTIFVESIAKEVSRKKFFIFEEEVNLLADVLQSHLTKKSPTFFTTAPMKCL